MFGKKPEEEMSLVQKLKAFMIVHWKGVVCLVTPLILLPIVLPSPTADYNWVGYTLLMMAVYWVTECIPLAITSFIPIIIFPFASVMTTTEVCKHYINDAVLMFIGSLVLAYSIEQSGLHKRLAYGSIRLIGYSHLKLLAALCMVTTFVSMWITNTAATTMMVPILFALLRVFESYKMLQMYEKDSDGELVASDLTTAYFCAATYSATIGGIGTLVGTATNLAFKGLFMSSYPTAPEYLSFPLFSAFAIPLMIVLEIFLYLAMAITYFGLFRPSSAAAKSAKMTKESIAAAKKAIEEDTKKMGRFTFWEGVVLVLFAGAMLCFFSRAPTIFPGWGDLTREFLGIDDDKYIRDSVLAMLVCFCMFLFPGTLNFMKNFTAKYYEELPKGRAHSALIWPRLNTDLPYSFMFLIGGGFALSEGAKKSGLNDKIGEALQGLKSLPNEAIIFLICVIIILITNLCSNVAVVNVMAPLTMQLARELKRNPLWYCIVSGYCSSFCFLLPVGTPGNLIVQSAAKIPTTKMIICGIAPTIGCIIITFVFMTFYAPVIWPVLHSMPEWAA